MTLDVLKEWWYYFFQCTECRRCSVFCPYGIDTAEITIMGRELLNLLGLNIDWIATRFPTATSTGNHLGIQPHAFKDMHRFLRRGHRGITGIRSAQFKKKGRRHPVHHPLGRRVRRPGHLHLHGLHDALSIIWRRNTD
jgi:Fe-S oxidoreductase